MNERDIIKKHYAKIGAKGGRAGTGKAKSRGSDGGRKAAQARWKAVHAKAKKVSRLSPLVYPKGAAKNILLKKLPSK